MLPAASLQALRSPWLAAGELTAEGATVLDLAAGIPGIRKDHLVPLLKSALHRYSLVWWHSVKMVVKAGATLGATIKPGLDVLQALDVRAVLQRRQLRHLCLLGGTAAVHSI